MLIFPAIDLYTGKAVRLFKGDYDQMTVYSDHPEEIARDFAAQGATHVHLVDLEGARTGETPNLDTILRIRESTDLFLEVGGGIRKPETVEKYLNVGVNRVILGTAAVEQEDFLKEAIRLYGDRIAVGVDIRDGCVAIRGWTERSELPFLLFCRQMEELHIRTLICTDISRDGAMRGTNRDMYRELSGNLTLQIVASGGVSTLEDVKALRSLNLYGAIIGKAYYTGAIRLSEAIEVAR